MAKIPMDLKTRLAKAKTALVLQHPFLGTIAMGMPFEIDDTINPPTACTNGKFVKFHPDFCEALTDEELTFVVAHEICHPMLEHTTRRYQRQHRRWNQAGDYVINELLVKEKVGKMPEGGLQNTATYNAGGGTTDGIYDLLPEEDESGNNGHGDPLDDCQDGGATQAELAQQAAEWKVKVAQAAQSAKIMGKLSANLQRIVGDILEPKVNWRDVLQRFMQKVRTDDRSFARPNRRFISQGLVMPTISGEAMGEIMIAVDCSGSIGQAELDQFIAEIRSIKEACSPTAIHIAYFDRVVCHYDKFTRDDDLHIEAHGGGGTDFAPVFRYARDNNIDPVAIVFLTDMYGPFGDTPPDCPLLWISTSDVNTAPFGEVVLMRPKSK